MRKWERFTRRRKGGNLDNSNGFVAYGHEAENRGLDQARQARNETAANPAHVVVNGKASSAKVSRK